MVDKCRELRFTLGMRKAKAIELLGGSVSSAAAAVGVTYQAVEKWPDPLPDRIADRVVAALARRLLPAALLGETSTESANAKAAA